MGRIIKTMFQKEYNGLNALYAELKEKVKKLERDLEAKNSEIENRNKEITGLQEKNDELKEKVRESEITIIALENQLERKKNALSGNSVEISIDGIEELCTDEVKYYILSVLKKEKQQSSPKEYEREYHILDIIIGKNKISDGLEQLKKKIKQCEKEKNYFQLLKRVFTDNRIKFTENKNKHNIITIPNSGRDFVLIVSSTPSDGKSNKNNVQDLMNKILLRNS